MGSLLLALFDELLVLLDQLLRVTSVLLGRPGAGPVADLAVLFSVDAQLLHVLLLQLEVGGGIFLFLERAFLGFLFALLFLGVLLGIATFLVGGARHCRREQEPA